MQKGQAQEGSNVRLSEGWQGLGQHPGLMLLACTRQHQTKGHSVQHHDSIAPEF